MQVDLLAFGPHPDDIEIGIGGTLAKHVQAGQQVGLCDLTRGELGSNGTVEQRRAEADAALQVLGATWRENLGLPDGGLRDEPDQVRAVAELIRRARPRTVAGPDWEDRHPDHVGASRLVTAAAFRAGLRRADLEGEPFQPDWVCYYFINDSGPASFVVDVSAQYEIKRRALRCHRSQFEAASDGAVQTRLTSAAFLRLVKSRDEQFGARLGVSFGEGLVVTEPIVRAGLLRVDEAGV